MVYKLVEHQNSAGDWVAVSKRSPEKNNPAGRKIARREIVGGVATAEVIDIGALDRDSDVGRMLVHDFVVAGEIRSEFRGAAGVERARLHHQLAASELPESGRRLSPGDPAIPTVFR
jgi:nicotinate phosphoribosyltransferase